MIRTIILLIGTLILVPISIIYFDIPLSEKQSEVLSILVMTYLIAAAVCFIFGEITKNVSQVDKLWSTIPLLYVWIMAAQGNWNSRLVLLAILVTIWAVRLTYNFSRRGGYSWPPWKGEEDYRWSVLRRQPFLSKPWAWKLFHLFFICGYQMGLILLFCLPMLICYEGIEKPIGVYDCILALVFLILIYIEYIADQQQYDFQTEKYKRIANNLPLGEFSHGFVRKGLWSKVRHPNYAAEQAIWIVFYLFSIVATGRWVNWTLAGPVLLMFLFLGSSDFSEKISSEKYPEYKEYQKKTPRFLPF